MSSDSNNRPTRSLNRQEVLEEDEYTAALSEIIARDFFPSLVHLDATNSYLEALESKDPQLIGASVRRLQDLSTPHTSRRPPAMAPGRTPYAAGPSDTPIPTPRNEEGPNKRQRYDNTLSLDEFQARYTSEDNASFTEILDEENRKRKEKYAWAWEAQRRAREVKAIEGERRSRLLIEDSTAQQPGVREKFRIEAPDVKLITAEGEESKGKESAKDNGDKDDEKASSKALVKVGSEEGKEVDVMARKKDTRPAGVDGWSFKTRNSLMFPPDADRSPFDGPTSLPSTVPKGPPKIINHSNTRLPEQSNEDGTDTASTVPSSPTRSRVGAAIVGTPYVPREERNQFSLVPAIPSPTASQLGPEAVNKLMTWGTITATPRIISSDPDADMKPPATPFHLPGPSAREKVAHKLASSASRSLKAKAALLSATPSASRSRPPGTPRPTAGMLTPAARRLLDRTAGLGTSASRRADAMRQESGWEGSKAKDLSKVRWTPSPAARRGGV